MNKRTMAFLAVVATLGAGGLGLAACSSDSGGGGLPVGSDSGTQDHTSGGGDTGTGPGTDANPGTDTGTGDETGGGADCGKPNSLHPEDGGDGVYCPFQADGGPDASSYCKSAEKCCDPGSAQAGPSHCEALATDCALPPDAGAEFQCDSPSQCPGGQKCCLTGEVITDPSVPASCGKLKGRGVKGTFCRAACQAGESEVCWANGECGGGQTCAPFATFAIQLGYCK